MPKKAGGYNIGKARDRQRVRLKEKKTLMEKSGPQGFQCKGEKRGQRREKQGGFGGTKHRGPEKRSNITVLYEERGQRERDKKGEKQGIKVGT